MSYIAPLVILTALLVVSCGKKEEVRGDAPQPPQTGQQELRTPVTPLPERPAPDVPKGAVPEFPKAGQANSHSSPEFKGGSSSDAK